MARRRLTEDQYLVELNRQLLEDEDYEEGMAFLSWPPGAVGREMSGYHMAGDFKHFDWVGVYARVADQVSRQFELSV